MSVAPFRSRFSDEPDQQYSFRRTLHLITAAYFEPLEVRNDNGSLVAELQPGEGMFEYTFNRLVEAFARCESLVENPPSGFFTIDGSCFTAQAAGVISWAQYFAWDCDEYFAELTQAFDDLASTSADARFERVAFVATLAPAAEDWEFRDDGQSETIEQLINSDTDRQENIVAEKENVISAATETPSWLPLALVGILGFFVVKASRA